MTLLVRGAVGYLAARERALAAAYAVLMLAVCMLACAAPRRRELRIEPTEPLRE